MTKLIYPFPEIYDIIKDKKPQEAADFFGLTTTNLIQLEKEGILVKPGFVLTTEAYKQWAQTETHSITDEMWSEIQNSVHALEKQTNCTFGSLQSPLLLSIRGDSPYMLPGVHLSAINVGLTDVTAQGLTKITKNRGYVYDSYRRLIEAFGTIVLKIPPEAFESLLVQFMASRSLKTFSDFSQLDWIEVTKLYKSIIMRKTGLPFPQDPYEQLRRLINSILEATFSPSCTCLLEELSKNVPLDQRPQRHVSILIQQMSTGNISSDSLSAIIFTRDPINGSPGPSGYFSKCSTCDDVIKSLSNLETPDKLSSTSLQFIKEYSQIAEKHFSIPMTLYLVQEAADSKPFLIEAKSTSLSSNASIRAACDMVNEGLISKESVISNIKPEDLLILMSPHVPDSVPKVGIAKGSPAAPKAIIGKVYFNSKDILKYANYSHLVKRNLSAAVQPSKETLIFVCEEFTAKDYPALIAASAIITEKGNNSSLAATAARFLKKTAAIGIAEKYEDLKKLKPGDYVTITGDGLIQNGEIDLEPTTDLSNDQMLLEILKWADETRKEKMNVLSTASSISDIKSSENIGADSIGCLKVEDFFEEKYILILKNLLIGDRKKTVRQLDLYLKKIFTDVFKAASNGSKKLTIRLFEPQLYTFLPKLSDLLNQQAKYDVKKEISPETAQEEEEEEEEIDEDEDPKKKKARLLAKAKAKKAKEEAKKRRLAEEEEQNEKKTGQAALREMEIRENNLTPEKLQPWKEEEKLKQIKSLIEKLQPLVEKNPVLGIKGMKLNYSDNDLFNSQVKPLISLIKSSNVEVTILLPNISDVYEVQAFRNKIMAISDDILNDNTKLKIGAEICSVKGCMNGGEIASLCDLIAFNIKELSQTALAMADDSSEKYLTEYQRKGILNSPFERFDQEGVGELLKLCIDEAKAEKEQISIGVLSDLCKDPKTLEFFSKIGVNSVICDQQLVPIARLCSAQSILTK